MPPACGDIALDGQGPLTGGEQEVWFVRCVDNGVVGVRHDAQANDGASQWNE